jgi:hypothetical protein
MSDQSIAVVTVAQETESAEGEMGIFRRKSTDRVVVREIPIRILAQSVSKLCSSLGQVLENADTNVGPYGLHEVTISAEVTAEGGVNLVGYAQAGTAGTISLTFTKS